MKKVLLSVVAAATLCATSAMAADLRPVMKAPPPPPPPSPWDMAFGAWTMNDYNFRGISQSNRGPSVTAYSETRFNASPTFQLYAGSQLWAVTLPTNPTAEVDFFAGVRPTLGPLAFDFGFIYYYYPKEKQHAAVPGAPFPPFPNGNTTLDDTDYWEVYGKVVWDVVANKFALGANVYYSPDWLATGSYGTYASVTAKFTGPSFKFPVGMIDEVGWYISGEFGHYWFDTTDLVPGVFVNAAGTGGIALPDYSTWNAGIAFTWKVFTLDLRYYDTDLTKTQCNTLTGDPNAIINAGGFAESKWCNPAFIATFKFDLTLANLK